MHVYAFSSLTTGFSSFSAEQMSPKEENLLIIKTRHSPHLVPRDTKSGHFFARVGQEILTLPRGFRMLNDFMGEIRFLSAKQ